MLYSLFFKLIPISFHKVLASLSGGPGRTRLIKRKQCYVLSVVERNTTLLQTDRSNQWIHRMIIHFGVCVCVCPCDNSNNWELLIIYTYYSQCALIGQLTHARREVTWWCCVMSQSHRIELGLLTRHFRSNVFCERGFYVRKNTCKTQKERKNKILFPWSFKVCQVSVGAG